MSPTALNNPQQRSTALPMHGMAPPVLALLIHGRGVGGGGGDVADPPPKAKPAPHPNPNRFSSGGKMKF